VPAQLKTVCVTQSWRVAEVDLVGRPGGRVDAEELPRAGLRHDERPVLRDDPIEVGTCGLREVACDREQRRGIDSGQRPVCWQWDDHKLRVERVGHVHGVTRNRHVVEEPGPGRSGRGDIEGPEQFAA